MLELLLATLGPLVDNCNWFYYAILQKTVLLMIVTKQLFKRQVLLVSFINEVCKRQAVLIIGIKRSFKRGSYWDDMLRVTSGNSWPAC